MTAKDWITITISILSFLGFGTVFTTIWSHFIKKQEEHAKALNKSFNEEQRRNLDMIVKEDIKPLKDKVDKIEEDGVYEREALIASLKNDLLHIYYDCKAKGYKTNWDAHTFEAMYVAYTKMGGNSFIKDDIKPKFDRIENKDDEK